MSKSLTRTSRRIQLFSKELDRFPDAHLIDESGEFADMMRVFLPKPAPERGQIVSSKDVWSVKDTCGALAKHMLFDAKVLRASLACCKN